MVVTASLLPQVPDDLANRFVLARATFPSATFGPDPKSPVNCYVQGVTRGAKKARSEKYEDHGAAPRDTGVGRKSSEGPSTSQRNQEEGEGRAGQEERPYVSVPCWPLFP
jgi:hypothetical protein